MEYGHTPPVELRPPGCCGKAHLKQRTRSTHLPLGIDAVRGEHPAATQQDKQLGKSASFLRKLLREAVNRRSGGLPRPQLPEESPKLDCSPPPEALAAAVDRPSSPSYSAAAAPVPSHQEPTPLFPPTALIIGDSIVRHIHFANAVTHCFPGATTADILEKLPGLLESAPVAITKVIVHCGTNDTAHTPSERTKVHFAQLFNPNNSGKSAFISGPLPTLGRGDVRFSRILYLHTWLQSVCAAHNIHFIHNFDMFWERPSFFGRDGLHLSMLGCRMLAAKLRHAVRYAQDYTPTNHLGSRMILYLHTWLQSVCAAHNIHFIHNFDMFWERPSFFGRDGLHLSMLGCRMLAAKLRHAVSGKPPGPSISKLGIRIRIIRIMKSSFSQSWIKVILGGRVDHRDPDLGGDGFPNLVASGSKHGGLPHERISWERDFHVKNSPLTAMDHSAIKDNHMSAGNPWKRFKGTLSSFFSNLLPQINVFIHK
ncbi:hypothetical protein N1851_009772 [Merluccius polli]|uniref:SGNH hydrolase-type esterase domain-containing protein n=1 Tax=Merluccius polli TaxID=89951 RepID=A0AA47N0L4_MERPO|nr:hypothetical protein N1851_009772 [Merluccius polli]